MKSKPYNIELHIEELVLHGFAHTKRAAIGAAIQGELAKLFAERGIHPSLARGYNTEKLDGGAFKVKSCAKAEAIGTDIAQSLYGGLENV